MSTLLQIKSLRRSRRRRKSTRRSRRRFMIKGGVKLEPGKHIITGRRRRSRSADVRQFGALDNEAAKAVKAEWKKEAAEKAVIERLYRELEDQRLYTALKRIEKKQPLLKSVRKHF